MGAESEGLRRPVLVITRDEAIPVLNRLVVAPLTRTIRGIPTEIALGHEQGLSSDCVASFDNLQPIRRSFLTELAGGLGAAGRPAICEALRAMSDC